MVKEFVLMERQEYDQLRHIPTVNNISENMDVTDNVVNASMLSTQPLLNVVKSRVGVRYHNKVYNLFEFLKTHPSVLSWSDFGEAIVDGKRLPGSNVHDMIDYSFHDWRKLSKQSPPQGLDKLVRILFHNGFDPENVVNRRLRVLSCK